MTTKARKSAEPGRSSSNRAAPPQKPVPTKKIRPAKAPKQPSVPARTSKQQRCLDLLARRDGATLAELVEATDWQAHSVRGFLSGTVKKKLGVSLTSIRDKDGARRYLIDRAGRGR